MAFDTMLEAASSPKSTSARTMRAGALLVTGRLVSKLIDFGTLLVLTRLLQPADFGLVAMGSTLVLLVEAVLELPLSQALLRLRDATREAYDTAFTLSLLRGCLIGTLVVGLARPLALFYSEPRLTSLVLVLGLAPILRGLVSPRMVKYQRELDFRWNAVFDVSGKLCALATGSAVAFATRSYWALAASTTVTPLAMVTISYAVAPYRPRLSLARWREFADMLSWQTVAQLVTALNWQMDKFILGRHTDALTLGRFFMAENVSSIPNNAIIGPLSHPLMAAFVPLVGTNDIKRAYCKASNAVFLIGAPPMLVLALLSEPAIRIAFDPKWLSAAPLLKWLALSNIIALPLEPITGLSMALNRTRLHALRCFMNFALRLPLTVGGIIYFGVMGAVAARAAANLGVLVFGMFLLTRLIELPLRDQLRSLLRPLAALATMACVLLLLEPSLEKLSSTVVLALATAAVALLATSAYVIVAFFKKSWLNRLRSSTLTGGHSGPG